jgi:hypothetical protein
MATVNFSVPDVVKREFDELFNGENESTVLTDLMRRAIEERKRTQRRKAAFERILHLRETAPTVSDADIQQARNELREWPL